MNQWATKRIPRILTSSSALIFYAGLTVYLCAIISILFTKHNNFASIWIANAVLLVFIFRSSHDLTWKYIAIGFIASVIANFQCGSTLYVSLIYSISNAIEIIIPVLCVSRKKNEKIDISRLNQKTAVLAASILAACATSAIVATSATTNIFTANALPVALNWFTIDYLAMIAILPLGLVASHENIRQLITSGKLIEFLIATGITIITVWTLTQFIPIRYAVILLPILYSAVRFGLLGTSITGALILATFTLSISSDLQYSLLYSSMQEFVTYNSLLMSLILLPGFITAALIEQRLEFETKLLENEKRFRSAIEYSAIGMSLMSTKGEWLVVNPALCKITGYSENELLKMTFQKITYPEDLEKDLELLEKLISHETPSYSREKRYIKKNGERVWVSVIVSGAYDHSGKITHLISQVEDITQRKRMELALQESEQRWKFALEGGNQGVWDWNKVTNTIYYSRTWKSMLGFADNEISNNPDEWFSRVHPEEIPLLQENLNQHLSANSDDLHFEHRILCNDNLYKWFLVSGKVISRLQDGTPERIIGTFTDIDLIKKSEVETEKMSRRLQMAIDSGKIGIFNYDIGKDQLTWDDRMFEVYNLERNEFSHNFESWKSLIHPDDYQSALHDFNQAIYGLKEFDTEFRIMSKSKEVRWIRARAQVLRDNHCKPITMLGMNWDITNEKKLVHELFTEKERLNTTLKAIGDAVIVTDANGTINFINSVAEQLIGCNAKIAIGKTLYEICKIISETTGELLEDPIEASLKKKKKHCLKEEGVLVNYVGSRYFIQDSAAPIILPSGEVAGSVLVLQDVTTNRNLQTELKHQATHDGLTGLINRREIESKIRSLISTTRTAKNTNCLFFLDLDNFKLVNDTAGHAAGDELLKRVAEMLASNIRATDTVARLGGDEFAVILPNCGIDHGVAIAETLIDKIKKYSFAWEDKTYEIGASIGLVNFISNETTLETLLSHADIACYTAKNLGGNRVSIFEGTSSDASKYLDEIQMGPKIKRAVEKQSFVLYAQEIRPLQSNINLTSYYEILLRMKDDAGNLLLPATFMKSAERQDLMSNIDHWVIKKILFDDAPALINQPKLNVSINISAASINCIEFHKILDDYLTESKVNKKQIGFEIKEIAFSNDTEISQAFLSILEKHGCFVSMENFGKGLSTIQYLKRVPMLYIKIDGNYIRGIDTNPVERAIVESINQLAHKLGARTVAEFVESEGIMRTAREIGIDYGQGYAIGKSIPLDELFSTLNSHTTHRD